MIFYQFCKDYNGNVSNKKTYSQKVTLKVEGHMKESYSPVSSAVKDSDMVFMQV